ncbi:glycoside hydrolase family 79 protein [Vararia minispora EC-137]|uniref:Glycoside hydrolase family 79 protein n=1 Tax=Vararia minispora EC-137 TaxID=1314806 RepID=A0ACB8QF00_9AGAM|nr:glycoside hydrolase family 79 protein [Vararia minispora EC-137]
MARASVRLLALALLPALAAAQTVYYPKGQVIMGGQGNSQPTTTTTATTGAVTFTGAAAYNPTTLSAPAAPTGLTTQFTVPLFQGGMTNMSIPIPSNFMGFSIEMSVFNQYRPSLLNIPFLNLVANVAARAGSMQIRVGGNSQETAELVGSIANGNGSIISKDLQNVFNHNTPPIMYTADLFYLMNNISNLVPIAWYMGIPFFNVTPVDFNLAVHAEQILGNRLIALQSGNEPDLYAQGGRNHRPVGYAPQNYSDEIGSMISQAQSSGMPRQNDIWLVGSVSTANTDPLFSPDAVWATGLVNTYLQQIHTMSVERYPNNNCAAVFNTGAPIVDPQSVLGSYLSHAATYALQQQYAASAGVAVGAGKPLVMFETNTASCNGFVGISDAFVGALWAVDWAMSLAAGNFSGVLFHFGGQSSFYNPFTPPPGNQTKFRQWTVGPVYYSTLVVAEALGKNNQSQVVDLFANGNNALTPAWAIYEAGTPKKVLLINYASDPSGASTITASIQIGGGSTGQAAANPGSVRVKRLTAPSVVAKGAFTWAGQTFGNAFESDGRPAGTPQVDTVQCDPNNGCAVQVPAGSLALVFLTNDAFAPEDATGSASAATFSTSTHAAQTLNTATIDLAVLATSNGHGNVNNLQYATSPGSRSGAVAARAVGPMLGAFVIGVAGLVLGIRRWM